MRITPRLFFGLAIAAAASLAAAGAIYATSNTWSAGEVSGEALFPKLADAANTVTTVELTQGGKTLTLTRQEDRWLAREHGGFAVQPEEVRALIVKLARAELIEAKTRNPDKYALLGLADPAAKDGEARLVKLLGGDGKVVAEAVLGKKRQDAFGGGRSGLYVRKPGRPQTWLADLDVDPKPGIKDWVDIKLIDIEPEQIRAVTLAHDGEVPVKIRKGAGKDAKFELADVPEGAKLKDSASAEAIAKGFARIELEDLRKLDMTPVGDNVGVARLETEDGLTVTFRLRKEKDGPWLSLTAEGTGKATDEATRLNARLKGWEYRIPAWKADSLFKRHADFFETS